MAAAKRSLSKNITAMKFMQRRSKQNDREDEDSKGGNAFSCHPVEQWIVPGAKTFTAQTRCDLENPAVDSIAVCIGLDSLGRKSFNGFNVEIEVLFPVFMPSISAEGRKSSCAHTHRPKKLMQEESVVAETTEADDEEEMEGTIPALEVAARYQQLMNKHIALPVKRVPSRSKTEPRPKKFLKPSVD